MVPEETVPKVNDGIESIMSRRTVGVLLGCVALGLGAYGVADNTGHTTPIQMPTGTRELPWLNNSAREFLVNNSAIAEAKCGRRVTFLKNFYDDQGSRHMDVWSVSGYEQIMNSFASHKLGLSLRTEIEAKAHDASVVGCDFSPTVSYVQETSITTHTAAKR